MYEIVIDIETTGLNILEDVPIELGYVVYYGREEINSGSFYIRPHRKHLPLNPQIVKITGIDEERLEKHGISTAEATQRWHNLVWRYQPCTLVGYNLLNFDFPMIQNWLATYHSVRFKHPPIAKISDVMHMVGIAVKTRSWLKLREAAELLQVSFAEEDLHTALGDVRLTYKIYDKIREFA